MSLGAADYRLVVPTDANFLHHVRLFAAAVARRYGLSDDEWIADLKLLVSEAASYAIAGPTGHVVLVMTALPDSGFEFRLSPVPRFAPSDTVPDPYDIVTTLADRVTLDDAELLVAIPRP